MNTNQTSDSNRKLYSVLSYIGILFIVGLLAAKDDEKVKFHVNNGIILFIVEVAFGIITTILSALTAIPLLGVIIAIVYWLFYAAGGIVLLIIAIKGILAAAADKEEPLFLIGGFVKDVKIVK